MRLIDADALIAEMHNVILEDGEDRRTFYAVIERQPTVEERKTGKWCKSYADHEAFGVRPFFRYCSCCNEITVHPYKYCPNCGAKMEESDED